MKYQPEDLNKKTMWILGTKLPDEKNFHVQVITEYKIYSSLFTKLNNQKNKVAISVDSESGFIETKDTETDFYFLEIDLPIELKPDTPPF